MRNLVNGDDGLDPDAFTTAFEDFNCFYLRVPTREELPMTTVSVLDTLAFGDGPMRLTDLAKAEAISQPGLTQLVTRLERDGLVERRPDPDDGRAVRVHITEAGRRVGRSRHEDRTRQLRPLIARLTAGERQALGAALPALARLVGLGQEAGLTPPHRHVQAP